MDLGARPVGVQRAQPQGGKRRSDLLGGGYLQRLQMIPEPESGEKVPFDVQIAAKIRFSKPQRVSTEHRRAHHLGIAEHQGEWGLPRAGIGRRGC